MQRHTWRQHTDEGVRIYQAAYHASTWTLDSQLKGADEWEPHECISIEEWRKLRDVLWRKYQRGRCPWEFIQKIDVLLEELGEEGTS